MFHATGLPVPFGVATMKPLCWASFPNWVICTWTVAPSDRPWKSTTKGTGLRPSVCRGVVR